MPAAARRNARRPVARRPAETAPLLDLTPRPEPAGADLIAAVLTHADRESRVGPRRVRRALSPARAAELVEAGRLNADEALRSLDLAVIWDEAEAEVVRVIDDAPLRQKAQASRPGGRTPGRRSSGPNRRPGRPCAPCGEGGPDARRAPFPVRPLRAQPVRRPPAGRRRRGPPRPA